MIVTSISSPELELYARAHKDLTRAFEAIRDYLENPHEDGKLVLDGDALYANVFTYKTKAAADSCFEAHKRYIDVQVVLEGEEIVGFESADKLTLTKEYDAEGDYMLYGLDSEYDSVRLCRGEMAIIFPEEPHAPGMTAADGPTDVRKMVVKILA